MLSDQSDHLQTANRYLGRWDWEPYHMDQTLPSGRRWCLVWRPLNLRSRESVSRPCRASDASCGHWMAGAAPLRRSRRRSMVAPCSVAGADLARDDATRSNRVPRGVGHGRLDARPSVGAPNPSRAVNNTTGGGAGHHHGHGRFGQVPIPVPRPSLAIIAGWRHRSSATRRLGPARLVRPHRTVCLERPPRPRTRTQRASPASDRNHGQFNLGSRPIRTNPRLRRHGPGTPSVFFMCSSRSVWSCGCCRTPNRAPWPSRDCSSQACCSLLSCLISDGRVTTSHGWRALSALGLTGLAHPHLLATVLRHAAWRPAMLSLVVMCKPANERRCRRST